MKSQLYLTLLATWMCTAMAEESEEKLEYGVDIVREVISCR